MNKVYRNSTEVANVGGVSLSMEDIVRACLMGKLNLFLQGDTGSGKTQLMADAMSYFPGKNMFILGRNDMDVRELFQQVNLDKLRTAHSSEQLKELTDKVNHHLIGVDELPNCVPAVRAQLFNLFDGYVELNGQRYDIGKGYSVGIATGNIGQKFTESSNELGRALKDRMHVIIDTDYFMPTPLDTLEILSGNQNPRVEFCQNGDCSDEIIKQSEALRKQEIPFEKLVIANYLLHGLDYCTAGGQEASKRRMKDAWPNSVDNHGQGSDEALVLPVSPRAAKSIIRLSQAFDEIARGKGGQVNPFDSMMQAYKFVSAYSGILNEAAVQANYAGNKYGAMDAIVAATRTQFYGDGNETNKGIVEKIDAGLDMVSKGKLDKKILDQFTGRWKFMADTLEGLAQQANPGA